MRPGVQPRKIIPPGCRRCKLGFPFLNPTTGNVDLPRSGGTLSGAHLRVCSMSHTSESSLCGRSHCSVPSGNGLERRLLAFLDPLLSCAAPVVEARNGPIPGGRFPTGITSVVSEGNNEVGDYLVAALRGEPRLITYVRVGTGTGGPSGSDDDPAVFTPESGGADRHRSIA